MKAGTQASLLIGSWTSRLTPTRRMLLIRRQLEVVKALVGATGGMMTAAPAVRGMGSALLALADQKEMEVLVLRIGGDEAREMS